MKLTHAILGLALVGLLSFSIANYTKLANMIDKNTKTWEERYDNALVKLEEKANNYDRQIFELQVQVKKDEYQNTELHKKHKKSELIIKGLLGKLREVSDNGKFEYYGTAYTANTAQVQKHKWLLEFQALELEVKHSDKKLAMKKSAIEKLEGVHLKLQQRIAAMRAQGQELATKKKIKELQAKLAQLDKMDTNPTVGDKDMDELKGLIAEANGQIRDIQAREAVEKERQNSKKFNSTSGKSLSDIATVEKEDAKVSLEDLEKRLSK